ncbi:pyruvate, water dikinase regulatory protein [Candidatus Methylocalor cossyra]|uniref:Putative phosphoenolpyruvate synthase regulatory protein n=1 Tax=Candidatus Methylocalor cossyra TaxID=3108543 RepID=A0ABP1C451_9GAMM
MTRSVLFISDHTCITAETIGRSLLSQFPALVFERSRLPYTDSEEKLRHACQRIAELGRRDRQPPLVFSTLADPHLRRLLKTSDGIVFDLFDSFLRRLEVVLGQPAAPAVGRAHGLVDTARGRDRIEALKFALETDDGLRHERYQGADLILVGVSRSGKTPTCLYLAMHYRLFAANYPLTEDDLMGATLPPLLTHCQARLFGLTMHPERLHQFREERRPGSRYASLDQCRWEISAAERLFEAAGIPYLDTSNRSVEEVATRILQKTGLKPERW